MKEYKDDLATIYIDVDDTITPDMGNSFFPKAIESIIKLSKKANIIIWSKGGLNYTKEIINKANLVDYIAFCMPKPDLIIDDLSFSDFSYSKMINRGMWDLDIDKLEGNWVNDRINVGKI
ncbi:hypothetical protein NBN67_19265 [Clostridioides difficile]|uniref:hypothetical protein n=1 Tax=Clostridioides difficile TaxID=1496 RepID=UPI0020305A2C|nr:hypothetical protein [Clostridioides difficile]MCM0739677.1 hypothetical protein [Clostridioides difficile]HBF2930527.1 hypothetical protein [Clostridioides difficile]HBF2935911.1 hypothetical protein [Clostridioides difficile]HBZ0282707.1 hypothetical protein [Clostridioides difficile]